MGHERFEAIWVICRQRFKVMTMTAFFVGLFLLAGCSEATDDTATATTSVTSSTTQQALPTSQPSTTTRATAPSTTTPHTGEPPVINLAGATTIYSPEGVFVVQGWLDRPAKVTVGNIDAAVYDDPVSGVSNFEAELTLEAGNHPITITVTDMTGAQNTVVLSVIVDPALERRIVYLQDVDLIERTLVVDEVEFLTGNEATSAALEDGFISADEELPDGYYMRNQDPEVRTLTLGDPRVVTLQACFPEPGPCVTEQAVDLDTWAELLAAPESAAERLGWNWYGAGQLPYWFTLQDGIVVQIQEQYLP